MRLVTETGRGRLSAVVACCALAALLALGSAQALADTNCGPPNSLAGSCFAAADGDQLDGPGDLVDWQSFTALAPIVDTSRGVDSKFAGGSKELEPAGWQFIVGNNTPKTDLLDGWSRLESGFLYVAFTRVKQQGDTYLSFELNQLPAGPAESSGIPLPQRSTGDVLITYDISTTDRISVGMCTWQGDAAAGDWLRLDGTPIGGAVKTCTHLDPTTNPAAIGAVNFGNAISAADNFLQDHGDGIGAGQFGEAAVNLNQLPDGAGRFEANPCAANGWFWMHSRSSDSVTSDPKDLLAGGPISNPSCHLTLDKKVSLSGVDGTFTDAGADNPLAAEVGDTVTYEITVTNTGTAALSVDIADAQCDAGTLTGSDGRDGSGDPLAAGETATYTCTHLLTAADANEHPLVNTACASATAAATPIADDPCDTADVAVFQPGQLAKADGTKFQDTNGNGVHDSGEGPLAAFVFYLDYNDNGTFDSGEPAAASGADGRWEISGIKPGTWSVREASDPNFTCTLPSPCVRQLTFTAGGVADAGDWGNAPRQTAATPQQTPAGQLVLGARIVPGTARLLGPSGCTARAFRARVRGTKIARVVYILDGRVVRTLRHANHHETFAVRIDPRRLSPGVHRLVAQVTFQRGSGTKPKTLRLSFQRCSRAVRAPRFTG